MRKSFCVKKERLGFPDGRKKGKYEGSNNRGEERGGERNALATPLGEQGGKRHVGLEGIKQKKKKKIGGGGGNSLENSKVSVSAKKKGRKPEDV